MALGNISTSSLIKTAQSRQEKIRAYEDSLAKFNFDSSAKTYDDYQNYTQHLLGRAQTSRDPSDQLSIQRSLRTARRTYTSHEIQRQTINVLEGTGTLQGKYNAMVSLYQYSVANDDLDLAQSLRGQLDSLDIQIQNQAAAAARSAERMAERNVRTIKEYAEKMINGDNLDGGWLSLKEARQEYEDFGADAFSAIAQVLGTENPVGGYWDYVQTVVEDVVTMYRDAAGAISDPAQANKLIEDANEIVNGDKTFEVAPGIGRLTYGEIIDAADAARTGQNLYEPVQKGAKNSFVRNQTVDYVWGRDVNGNVRIIELKDIASPGSIADKIDPEDEDSQTYEDVLRSAGYDVLQTSSDGTALVRSTTATLDQIPGLQPGQTFQVSLTGNGQLKIVTDASDPAGSRIFELGREDGRLREVTVEESAIQAVFDDQEFFSPDPAASKDFVKQLTGQNVDTSNPLNLVAPEELQVVDRFTQLQQPLSSSLIQGANAFQLQLQKAQAEALAAAQRSQFTSNDMARRVQQAMQRNIQESVAKASTIQNTVNPQRAAIGAALNQTQVPSNVGLNVNNQPDRRKVTVAPKQQQPKLSVSPFKPAKTTDPLNGPIIFTGTF